MATGPFPLTGGQRHIVSAIGFLENHLGDLEVADRLVNLYTYLRRSEALEIIHVARNQMMRGSELTDPEATGLVSDYLGLVEVNPGNRIIDVQISWVDPSGAEQFRTMRIAAIEGESVADLHARIERASDQMLSVVDGRSNDTIGTAPPNGESEWRITAII